MPRSVIFLSVTNVRKKLSALVKRVRSFDEEIVITKNGRPAAVLVSAGKFASWKETVAIRRDVSLMREIRMGLSTLKKRKARLYTLHKLLP